MGLFSTNGEHVMFIATPTKKTRSISQKNLEAFEKVEEFVMNNPDYITESMIANELSLDKTQTRAGLHRLQRLGVIADNGRQSNGKRGRPERIWSRKTWVGQEFLQG